jgi:hypothetical protein
MSAKNAGFYFRNTGSTEASDEKKGNDRDYSKFAQDHNNQKPFSYTTKNGDVYYFLCHHVSNSARDNIRKLAAGESGGKGCRACGDNGYVLANKSGPDGNIFFNKNSIDPNNVLQEEISNECAKICQGSVTGIIVVGNGNFPGTNAFLGGFHHTGCNVSSGSTVNIKLYNDALDRYVVQPLFSKLFETLTTCGVDKASASLKLMKKILDEVAYGKTFIPTVNWLLDCLAFFDKNNIDPAKMSSKDKMQTYAHFLFDSALGKDNSGTVCFFYHTANNNILDLLSSANSEDAMRKMCESRLSPENYQRRDPNAGISDQQIKNAMEELGNFSTSIMTTDELPEQAVHILGAAPSTSSSSSAFATMLDMNKVKYASGKSLAGDFASRCGITNKTVDISEIKRVKDLIDYLRKNPNSIVKISNYCGTPVYSASYTVCYQAKDGDNKEEKKADEQSKMRYPHLWAYMNGQNASEYFIGSYSDVSHILPLYEYINDRQNVLFIVKGVTCDMLSGSKKPKNCLFPEFLRSEYTRVHGKAFERLNTLMDINIPKSNLAFGIGTSAKDTAGTLYSNIQLVVNGVNVTLTTL